MSLHDFESGVRSVNSVKSTTVFELGELVKRVTQFKNEFTASQIQEMYDALRPLLKKASDGAENMYGTDFSIADEINELLLTSRAMRRSVMTSSGDIQQDISTREVKEVLSSSTTLINSLMKSHEKVMSMERFRAVEAATIDTLLEVGDNELVEQFMSVLTAKLDVIS